MDEAPLPFTIDVPVPADAPALAAVHVAAWRDAYAQILPERFFGPDALARRQAQWTRTLTERTTEELRDRLRVSRSPAGIVTGFCWVGAPRDESPPTPTELSSLYVVRALYGTGAARALVAALLGDRPAHLWVADPNPRAQAFYAKLGFAPDGAVLTAPDLDGLREIRMVRGA